MSITKFDDNVPVLAHFNKDMVMYDHVFKELKLTPEHSIERLTAMLVFESIMRSEHLPKNKAKRVQAAAEETIDELFSKLDLMQKYEPDFFHGLTCNRDPMVLCLLGGEYLMDKERTPIAGLAETTVEDAMALYKETGQLEHGKIEPQSATPESLFITSVNAYDDLDDMHQVPDDYDPDDIKEYVEDFPLRRTFMRTGTLLERDLNKLMRKVESGISSDAIPAEVIPLRAFDKK